MSPREQEKSNGNWRILAILASVAMMVMFIEIMLVPALPYVGVDFNNFQWISWVLSIYLLVGAVATPLAGRLGDMYGKKRIMLYVMCIYIIGLLGSGFSLDISRALLGEPSIFVLIFFRGVQGIGMGMFPLAFGIIRDTFPKDKIPTAIGTVSAMFSVGVSLGLLGGGYITSVGHWYDAFHVVVPFFAALTILTMFLIKDPIIVKRGSLDMAGAATLGIGVFSLLLGLTQGQEWGWASPLVLALFVLALSMFLLFTKLELRTKDPIVRLSMFRNRGVLDASVTAIFIGFCMFLMFQTLPFFLETPKAAGGFFGISDTFVIGLYMFPSAIAQLIFGPMGGILSKKFGADKVLMSGLAIMALGFATLVFMHTDWVGIVISIFITGAGMALCMVSMINLVVVTCKQSEFGVASGMNTLFRVVGGAIGPVLAVVILSNYTQIILGRPVYTENGYVTTWIIGAAFSLIGLACAVLLRPKKGEMECDIAPEDLPAK
ncbi:MAG TPA: MFS transporter [Methanomassiliicoccales archaeon]